MFPFPSFSNQKSKVTLEKIWDFCLSLTEKESTQFINSRSKLPELERGKKYQFSKHYINNTCTAIEIEIHLKKAKKWKNSLNSKNYI